MTVVDEVSKLVAENPGLPIVPIVNSEDVEVYMANGWAGNVYDAYVAEYFVGADGCTYYRGKNRDYIEGGINSALFECGDIDKYDAYHAAKSPEERRRIIDSLPWEKAILLFTEPHKYICGDESEDEDD